jgi:hypothetical protein
VRQKSTLIPTYLAAAWASFSHGTGTCTGNDAGQLGLIVLSIPRYFLAAFSFARVPRRRVKYLIALAILPAAIWQVLFSTWLAFHLIFLDASACRLLFGGTYGLDGKEVWYAILWLLPLLAVPFALVLRRH